MAITQPGGCSLVSAIKNSILGRKPNGEESEEACSELQQKGEKKSVSFFRKVRAKKYLHVRDFSDDEVEQCWYSKSDLRSFRSDARITASLVEDGLLKQDTDKICFRGVEKYIRPFAQVRKDEIDTARDILLDEQDLQWEEGVYDEQAIADLYRTVVKRSLSKALEFGLHDELQR